LEKGLEDAIYDSHSIRASVGIDLVRESTPRATRLLKSRHLLEANKMTRQIFNAIN
jgi:IS5 family transposase